MILILGSDKISWEAVISVFAVLFSGCNSYILTKNKADRTAKELEASNAVHNAIDKEMKTYLDNLNVTLREHVIMQQVTTTTLTSIMNRLELFDNKINEHSIQIAVIKEREGRNKPYAG